MAKGEQVGVPLEVGCTAAATVEVATATELGASAAVLREERVGAGWEAGMAAVEMAQPEAESWELRLPEAKRRHSSSMKALR